MTKKHIIAGLLGCAALGSMGAGLFVSVQPAHAIPVFDSTNYAQNLLQAARALQQINNQIRSLQNEATMIANMAKNLERIDFPQLQQIRAALQQIDQLMGQAQGIDFRLDQLDERFRALFPDSFDDAIGSDQRVVGAKAQLDAAMAGYRHTMGVQSKVVENVQGDARLLAELVERSQGAQGGLQAQQATNQLLALAAKQQFQIQNLMAAQFRAEATERARRIQAEAEGRAATRRFLGAGKAYTPQ